MEITADGQVSISYPGVATRLNPVIVAERKGSLHTNFSPAAAGPVATSIRSITEIKKAAGFPIAAVLRFLFSEAMQFIGKPFIRLLTVLFPAAYHEPGSGNDY